MDEELTLIVLVGMPGAGKSSCVQYLEERGVASVYIGGITMDEVKDRGLVVNEQNEKIVREDIRAKEGYGAYAKRIITKIRKLQAAGHPVIVVDGLYSWTEYKVFKETFDEKAVIVAVTAPRKLRHERLANRTLRPLDEAAAISREYAEIENLEKGGPIANADFIILNNSSKENLLNQFKNILHTVGVRA